jgi:Glutathione S-transferase, N-terminal domain
MSFELLPLSPFSQATQLRQLSPIGRMPVLILANGEVLIESAAILDYLDDIVGTSRALLEAQAGVFLVDDEIIDDYPFNYLLFPASLGPEPSRARAAVYPEKKSDLELILDQWFWHEQASTGTRRLWEMLDQSAVAPHRITFEPTDGVGLKSILRPEPHHSWSGGEKTWLRATERFDSVLPRPGDTFQINLLPGMSLDAVRSLAATLLPLDSLADRRRRSADWRVLVDGSIDLAAGKKLARQWDALRIDGYADAQVVASFAASISILALQLGLIAGWPSYGGSLGISDDIKPLTSLFAATFLWSSPAWLGTAVRS